MVTLQHMDTWNQTVEATANFTVRRQWTAALALQMLLDYSAFQDEDGPQSSDLG